MSTSSIAKIGLIGTGPEMAVAIRALQKVPSVEIAVVADSGDRSEGAKLAKSLKLPLEKNWMAVFHTDANLILEVNGDDRQYERLLSIKPPAVEVMSVRGTAFLLQLLRLLVEGPASGKPEKTELTSREFKLIVGIILGLAGVAFTSMFLGLSRPSDFVVFAVLIVALLGGVSLLSRLIKEVPKIMRITRERKLKLGITLTLVGLAFLALVYLPLWLPYPVLEGEVFAWLITLIARSQGLSILAIICFFVGLGLVLFGIAEPSRGR